MRRSLERRLLQLEAQLDRLRSEILVLHADVQTLERAFLFDPAMDDVQPRRV